MVRVVDLCGTVTLPGGNRVDNPGLRIGTEAGRAGTVRVGSRALVAVYQATVPWISIILRRVFGVAGAGHGNAQALNLRYAWPSGRWGSLPIAGGALAEFRQEIESAADPEAKRLEIEERLKKRGAPRRTATDVGIRGAEEVRDTLDNRPPLGGLLKQAKDVIKKTSHQ